MKMILLLVMELFRGSADGTVPDYYRALSLQATVFARTSV
jgi:hypothetical protein